MIAKPQSKREKTDPVCLHAVEKYKKVESINTQTDYETASKKCTNKKKTDWFFAFCVFKFQENKFKIARNNF